MSRPLLLDLFCGGGGAGMGYHRAGFDVIGVDVNPQSDYPFEFVQADVFEFIAQVRWAGVDAVHASPPCQAHTSLRVMHNAQQHPDLVAPTRDALVESQRPYVIENVVGAPLFDPIRLCGTSFNLGVEVYDGWRQLRRHRLFESSFAIEAPACRHDGPTIGFYGDHARDRRRKAGVHRGIDFPDSDKIELGRRAMGMPWATRWRTISQAIPPAYTEHIGKQLIAHLDRERVAA